MTLSLDWLEPSDLLLPAKFDSFRAEQIDAVEEIANSTSRFIDLCLPPGCGKSLIAVAAAKVTGLRTVICTSTRGLQDQYQKDFEQSGLVDIRGKSNYVCGDKRNLTCRYGEHEGCRLTKGAGCSYECQRDEARASNIVLTNYAYWIHINERSRGLETPQDTPIGMLILDEAHKATEELSRNIQIKIRETWLHDAGLPAIRSDNFAEWQNYAGGFIGPVSADLANARITLRLKPNKQNRDRVYALEELSEAFTQIIRMNRDCWVLELHLGTKWGRLWEWDCVWPGQFAESRLFLGIQKIVLMSATIRPVVMGMLGVKKSEFTFREWPRIFPANRTPVYHYPTVRMNHRVSEDGLKKWVEGIDAIIESRLERKGIIHTGSYRRQQYLFGHSRFARYFHMNTNDPDSDSAAEIVAKFKAAHGPAILVSPSVSTGWDFPGRQCEWQIVTKIAFPDTRSKVMQARKQRSERYINYLAMQDLIQACFRGTRFFDDRCEVFIVDDSIGWFMMQNKSLAPRWFEIIKTSQLPAPGPRAPELPEIAA